MKVAVVGSGISGIAAAWGLRDRAQVVLYEALTRLGGHTDTHAILNQGRSYAVDSGFIVFNQDNYPRFSSWLDELQVPSQPSDMSFSVRNDVSGVEYGSCGLGALLCQRRNALSPGFLGMLADLRRFYGDARSLPVRESMTLGRLVEERGYGKRFVQDHLVPMCGALWSLPDAKVTELPAAHVIAFMEHHKMLQLGERPEWRVVRGGSSRYLKAFAERFDGEIRLSDPVRSVDRTGASVAVCSQSGTRHFDAVVLACHSNQALALLADPTARERAVLGAIPYQRNRVVVHSDASVMPHHRRAWSSWNALVNDGSSNSCQVTYWMNRLQGLPEGQQFFVTLNPSGRLRNVWSVREYEHPVFTPAARAAQKRRAEINGANNTFYCGAYWGWGFHEDGFASAMDVVSLLQERVSHAA